MAYAVSLWMDDESEQVIRDIWKTLHEKSLSSALWLGPYRPHVTLTVSMPMSIGLPFRTAARRVGIICPAPGTRTARLLAM